MNCPRSTKQYRTSATCPRTSSSPTPPGRHTRTTKETFEDFKDHPEAMEWMPVIDGPEDVFNHVTFGRFAAVYKGYPSTDHFFIGIECACAWEEEDGWTFQLRDGTTLTCVGPFDDSGEWPDDTYDASGDGL